MSEQGWQAAGPEEIEAAIANHRSRKVRRELERRTEPELDPINLDPYPGTVGEVADEVARFVLELEDSGAARGVAGMVRARLRAGMDDRGQARMGRHAKDEDAVNILALIRDECTHGGDCKVHPDERRLHNLDVEPGPVEPEARAEAIRDWEESNRPY